MRFLKKVPVLIFIAFALFTFGLYLLGIAPSLKMVLAIDVIFLAGEIVFTILITMGYI